MLLQAGTKLHKIMVKGRDILHHAIDRGCNLKTVEILLQRGARIRSMKTALNRAAASSSADSLKIVQLLLQNGASFTEEQGELTLLESCLPIREGGVEEPERARRLQLFSVLLDNGAHVNDLQPPVPVIGGWSPLLTRLLEYDAADELIYRIIEAGANINVFGRILENLYYQPPLQVAARKGRLNIVHRLVDRGANINAEPGLYSDTALQAACNPDPGHEIDLNLIQFLIDNGANINAPATRGFGATALKYTIMRGSMAAFCLLLDRGADIHGTNNHGSVLDTAAEYGRLDMVDILLKKGAESYRQIGTPYMGAIEAAMKGKHFAIAKMLREFPGRDR
ncbi:ankyrin repeat-containing domain protein [Xylaria telfairii]|nr:ankyrin repeat-containing domain protein [Xylaria telfairii]